MTAVVEPSVEEPLTGACRDDAKSVIIANHYAHGVPSGKSHYFSVGDALFIFAIPANKNIGRFLLGNDAPVWELSRMWAPDNHEVTLTSALSRAVSYFRRAEPAVVALVSYADPNVGHEGGVYRAASWLYTGQSEEGRYYVSRVDGQTVSRRRFHSGNRSLTKAEILALGYDELTLPGKHRYCLGLTRITRSILSQRFGVGR